MTTALLIIAVQQALRSGHYCAFEADKVIDRINHVSALCRAAEVPVVLIQHETQGHVLDHGTPGWQLAQGLDARLSDLRLRKTATDSFHKTLLQALLAARNIDHLIICGLQSEFCVDTTTRRALALGYRVTLVEDAHSTMDNDTLSAAQISAHHNHTLGAISSFDHKVTPTTAHNLSHLSPSQW